MIQLVFTEDAAIVKLLFVPREKDLRVSVSKPSEQLMNSDSTLGGRHTPIHRHSPGLNHLQLLFQDTQKQKFVICAGRFSTRLQKNPILSFNMRLGTEAMKF